MTAPRPAPAGVVARVAGQDITWDMLQKPLVDAYGLQMTLHLVQLEMAKQKARDKGAIVTEADIADERQRTAESLFKETIEGDVALMKKMSE